MRGKKRGLAGLLLAGLGIGGCGVLDEISDVDPTDPQTWIDTFVEDVSLPNEGTNIWAQKGYHVSDNFTSTSNPDDMLFEQNFSYTVFDCSQDNPIEVVVGFEKEFTRITVAGFWNSSLLAEGYAASSLFLAKEDANRLKEKYVSSGRVIKLLAKPVRFIRTNRGGDTYINQLRPLDDFGYGGEIQFNTGPGNERYFMLRIWPESEGIVEVGIDSFQAGG